MVIRCRMMGEGGVEGKAESSNTVSRQLVSACLVARLTCFAHPGPQNVALPGLTLKRNFRAEKPNLLPNYVCQCEPQHVRGCSIMCCCSLGVAQPIEHLLLDTNKQVVAPSSHISWLKRGNAQPDTRCF